MKKKIDREFLIQKYCIEKQTVDEIGKTFGVSGTTIRRRLKELDIPLRSPGEANKLRWQRNGKLGEIDKEVLFHEYVIQGKSVEQIAQELGLAPNTVIHHMNKAGITRRSRSAFMRLRWQKQEWREKMSGINHHWWRGGRKKNNGYMYVKCLGHPDATKDGYVYEHRLVMEEALGRLLRSTERVHHKNGNTLDNRTENLELFSDTGEHVRYHSRLKNPLNLIAWPSVPLLEFLLIQPPMKELINNKVQRDNPT